MAQVVPFVSKLSACFCEHSDDPNGNWHRDSSGDLIPATWRLVEDPWDKLNPWIFRKAHDFACDAHKQDLLDRIPAVAISTQPQTQPVSIEIDLTEGKFVSGSFRSLFFKVTFKDEETWEREVTFYNGLKERMTKEFFIKSLLKEE